MKPHLNGKGSGQRYRPKPTQKKGMCKPEARYVGENFLCWGGRAIPKPIFGGKPGGLEENGGRKGVYSGVRTNEKGAGGSPQELFQQDG